MDEGCYNTYTISDSDDSVINEGLRQPNETSLKDDDSLSTEEEPEFFLQVLQRVLFEFYELYYMMLEDLNRYTFDCFFFSKNEKN